MSLSTFNASVTTEFPCSETPDSGCVLTSPRSLECYYPRYVIRNFETDRRQVFGLSILLNCATWTELPWLIHKLGWYPRPRCGPPPHLLLVPSSFPSVRAPCRNGQRSVEAQARTALNFLRLRSCFERFVKRNSIWNRVRWLFYSTICHNDLIILNGI